MSDRLGQGGLDPLKGIDGGMVERVARAIHADERKLSATDPGCGPSFDDDTEFHRHVCRKSARAAIKVMAEPTEAMIDAHTQRSRSSVIGDHSHFVSEAKQAWHAMIDEALK